MAIYPKMSLSDLRTASRQRADMVNSTFVSDAELNSYINASYYELYDLLVQKYGNDYYMKEYTFQLQGNVSRYDLPADFFKLLGVDLEISSGPDGYVSLRPFTLAERNRYSTANVQTWIGVTNLRYRISANKLWFTPSPQTGQTIRIWYVPRLAQLIDQTTLTVADPIAGDYITIGASTFSVAPTVVVTVPVSGDYLRIGSVDLMANEPVLTVNGPSPGASFVIGSTTFVEGSSWFIGGTDTDTAISIANAINAANISGLTATQFSNTIYLSYSAYSTLPLVSAGGSLSFSDLFLAHVWFIGVNNDASASNLAAAISGIPSLNVSGQVSGNVVSIVNSSASTISVSVGSYSNPATPGTASRLTVSALTLATTWPLGLSNTATAANIASAINSAGVVDVSATSNGAVVTLVQDDATDLALAVGGSTLGASTRLQFSSSTLSSGSQVADGISGWLEYVVTDAAIKMMQKEESDTSVLQLQKAALIKRVESAAENRDAGSPATIADVQWTNGTWPFGNGFGGGGGIP